MNKMYQFIKTKYGIVAASAVFVILTVLFAANPEVLGLVLTVQVIGFDVFFMFLVFQFRGYLLYIKYIFLRIIPFRIKIFYRFVCRISKKWMKKIWGKFVKPQSPSPSDATPKR